MEGDGNGWVPGPNGQKMWGRFGAAGLFLQAGDSVLLQHRVSWSDAGGTWALPGGARHVDESALDGALREAHEEAGVPRDCLRLRFISTFDVGYWSYATVGVEVERPFEAVIGDPESEELRWVPLDEVPALPLHPAFAASWPALRERLQRPAHLIVDAANVVGSRPDGWWRDRPGAAERLLKGLAAVAENGTPPQWFGLDDTWQLWPRISVVLEGAAKAANRDGYQQVGVVHATRDGDGTILEMLEGAEPAKVTVVTADRELRSAVEALGASSIGPAALLEAITRPAAR